MKARFIDIAGIRTRYLVAGDAGAYPLLLLHGYGATADNWLRNIDELGREFYVVAPDMLGFGFSDAIDLEGGPPQPHLLRHLGNLVEELGFGRFCVSGNSFGALIAILLHLERPHQVDKLIINGSGSAFNDDEQMIEAWRRVLDNGRDLLLDPDLSACRAALERLCYDPAAVPPELPLVRLTAYARPSILPFWEQGIDALMNLETWRPWRILDRLEEIDADTLVVWGKQDPGAPYQNAVEAIKRIKRARLVLFDECGHNPMYEHVDAYNREVMGFLRG